MNEQRKLYSEVLKRGRGIIGKYKPAKFNIIEIMIVVAIVALLAVVIFCPRQVAASQIPYTSKNAIRIIVGEAADESLTGMIMHAEVIRRRGHLNGCYGFTASHISGESKKIWQRAKLAWDISKKTNYSNGATGWGSQEDFRNKKWAINKKIVAVYRSHQHTKYANEYFYVEKNA